MCGICGVFRMQGPSPSSGGDDALLVQGMVDALRHRGPDGVGTWRDDRCAFGHTRLAIIDLACGDQPMFNETGDVALVFNGEIYNYRELRPLLAAKGHRFRTNSDTEVLVHGYEEWGESLVERLRGMFAFVVWDARRQRLVMARDRLGEKPLYYHVDRAATRLTFASEIKALFVERGGARPALNAPRLGEFLAFRSVSGEETLFDGVLELEPATVMVIEGGGVTRRWRYWSPEVPPAGDAASAAATPLAERGGALLTDAIRARLVSDVPLGTLTSGGLDSSLVSAIAAASKDGAMDTFCAGFREAAFDERPYARRVAERIHSRHHEVVATAHDIDRELERLTWSHDEPLTHPNSIPMHLVFRHAKERAGVTVLLSGEGADEVFGGYGWYPAAARRDRLRRWSALGPFAARAGAALGGAVGRRLGVLGRVLDRDYPYRANAVTGLELVHALVPDAGDPLAQRRALWPAAGPGAGAGRGMADDMFVFDQRTYLPPLLQRQDRMSMAAGVEARVVFLDHDLVAWANALPARTKLAGGERKALLKDIARRWLPDEIVFRDKVGFTMPLGAWMRPGGPLAERLDALRDPGAFVRGVAEGVVVDRLVEEHARGTADHADVLWTLLSLETWATIFMKGAVHRYELPGATRPPAAAPVPAAAE